MIRTLWLIVAGSLLIPAPARAQSREPLRLVFVGDMNFARSLARHYLFAGRGPEVFAGVREELRAADIAVGNLESILLERGHRSDTTNSPVFAGPRHLAIPLLLDAGFDVLGTANNHAWDFGRAGLRENLRWLDSAGLRRTGTGATLEEAWRPAIVRARGWTVAIIAATAMFNYPDLTVVGHEAECCVAWLDTLTFARRLQAARDSGANFVVAFIHQGPVEYRAVPHWTVVRQFRALARMGVDAIIAHHPHVPQGVEWVGRVPIVYSLGNFIFKQRQPWTDRGLWAELLVTDGAMPSVQLTLRPLAVGYTPRFATGRDSARVMAHVDSISRLISAARPRGSRRSP